MCEGVQIKITRTVAWFSEYAFGLNITHAKYIRNLTVWLPHSMYIKALRDTLGETYKSKERDGKEKEGSYV